jgi:hypothetical protein
MNWATLRVCATERLHSDGNSINRGVNDGSASFLYYHGSYSFKPVRSDHTIKSIMSNASVHLNRPQI